MKVDKRVQKRVSKYLLAKVFTPDTSFFAYVHDLAKNGIGMSCNRCLEPGTIMGVDLNVPRHNTMHLEAKVAWRRDLPVIARNKFSVGARISDPPIEYSVYVENLLKLDYERREHQRFTDVLEVESNDVLDLLDAATVDVSAKGLYVRTGKLIPVGQQLDLKLCGQNLEPIFCLAEVVESFTTDVDNLDHPYGAGMKIISFAKDDEERFTQYIKYLEELYRFHWPEGGEFLKADVEEESLTFAPDV